MTTIIETYFMSKFQISSLLTMPLKFYIRLLTLSPIHINQQVLHEIQHEKGAINLFDMGHVAVLIASIIRLLFRF